MRSSAGSRSICIRKRLWCRGKGIEMPEIDIDKEPTVFILAAASNPYGFPLGPDLKQQILQFPDQTVKSVIGENHPATSSIPKFKEALTHGDYGTIDYFLERKKCYRELGAFYIVSVIGGCEHQHALFPQREFYADLFHMLDLESESTEIPPISVVTLNYDRSLEQFLVKNVEYNCSDSHEEHALMKVKKLPIVHPHGSLGDIESVPYGQVTQSPASVHEATKRIKIVSDTLEESEEFQKAKKVIANAHNLIFLGFAYHPTTLNALLSPHNLSDKKVFGTSVRLSPERKSQTESFFNNAILLGGNLPCSDYLDHLKIGRQKLLRKKAK